MVLKPLYLFVISFIAGAALFSVYEAYALLWTFLATPFFLRKQFRLLVLIIVFAFVLGSARTHLFTLQQHTSVLDEFVGEEITVTALVAGEPDVRESRTRLTLSLLEVFDTRVDANILTSVERFPQFRYGDKLQVTGVLKKPENFETENGRVFDYISYLAKDGIFYTISFPETKLISSGHGNKIKRGLFLVKQKWLETIQKLIPDPHAALLGGLVVGAKESLGEELEEMFRVTGIIHIVVLSGYNVTIVAESLMRFFSFLPRFLSLSLGALSIILFAILTGASATIVRASIMALLVLLARATGRTNEITHALFLAAFFMVLHNPMIVLFDPSFQLSFLATLGLIYVAPQIEKYFKLVPTKWQLREFATATVATQIFVLPLLLYMVGELSLVALPVNILVLAFIPLTMLFGFLTGVIGFLSNTLAFPFSIVSYILLSYELFIVDLFARFPFASVSIPYFPIWAVACLYILFAFVLYKLSVRMRSD